MYLYYITDRRQLSDNRNDQARLVLERIRVAAEAGVDWIQLREKDLNDRDLVQLGRRAADIVASTRSPAKRSKLLINSRVDVAIACGADGVHLRASDISAADARAVFMQARIGHALIGVSCHTSEEVALAESNGADFVVLAPLFETSKGSPLGAVGLQKSCRSRLLPVLALGGVTVSNAPECIEAGASGIAGIRLFQDGNLVQTVSRLRALDPS